MRSRLFATAATVLISVGAWLVLLGMLGMHEPGARPEALAAPAALSVTEVVPTAGPNDLDTSIVITGADFDVGITVTLGSTALDDVGRVSTTTLTATVPWGMDLGVYTLTVENPSGGSASLTGAFTVTEAIGVWNAGELYGGDIGQVAVVSQTPEILYAVSEDVGMFRSEDGAESWSFQVAGGEYSVRNLAVDPVSPTVLYMFKTYDLYRSDDGGDTWTPLGAPGDHPFPHPTEPGTVLVSNPMAGQSGLWKSTDYGEGEWQAITETHGLTDTRVNNLVFDPNDPMTIYVGTEQGNLFVSSDGGTSWDFVDQPLEYIQALAINPRGDHELWVSNCCFCNPPRTLRSTNVSHTSWTSVAEPVGSAQLTSIEFAPDGWGDAYLQTLFVSECFEEVYSSTNGGGTWESIDPQTGEWHSSLGLHPSNPDNLYATGSRQAIYKTMDGGATWQTANEGLTALVPGQMATVKGEPGMLYAVTEVGLLKGTQGGATWQSLSVGGGDVSFVATDPFTPDRVYVAGGDVGKGSDVPIYISEDGGQTWPITSYLTEPTQYDQYAHLDPVIQPSPHNSQQGVLLAGVRHALIELGGAEAGSLYRSTDAGVTWNEIDVGQPISPVQDIAFDVISPTIVYMATGGEWHSGGALFRSSDGGDTWQRVGADDIAYAEDIAVEPVPPHRVFVLGNDAVYVSENHGDDWQATGFWYGGIEQILCTEDPSALYYATDVGLLRSTDGGQSYERASGALGWVPIYSLATVTDTDRVFLYAGTTGGRVEETESQAVGTTTPGAAAEGELVNAGVYRYTRRRARRIYLPLVLRSCTP